MKEKFNNVKAALSKIHTSDKIGAIGTVFDAVAIAVAIVEICKGEWKEDEEENEND